MSGLRRDLAIAFLIAVIVNSTIYGWAFFKQGSFRINAADDFTKIRIGMTRAEAERILARDHLTCKYEGICYFQDLRQNYGVFFDGVDKVFYKQVGPREYYHMMRF